MCGHPFAASGASTPLTESRLPPGADVPVRPCHDAEIVTYVFEGALAYEDSRGGSGVTHAGEFQRRAAAPGLPHRETNASRSEWAHVFRISLPASPGDLEPGLETRRFSVAYRRGVLCIVASPGGRDGSLHIQPGALIFSSILNTGQHLAYELAPRRSVWLHIVTGEVKLGEVGLTAGDGIGVTAEHAVSLIAQDESEILLVDS